MRPVVLLSVAQDEFAESLSWYQERSVFVVEAFETAVEETLALIGATPERWAKCGGEYRSCLVDGFPYHLVYREEARRVVVVAVAHSKRRFGYWKRR